MKISLKLIAFTTVLFFAFSRETEAGIYTWSGVEYDANTNSMRAYVGSQAAYEPGVYYCLESTGYIFRDEVEVDEVSADDINWSGWPSACTGHAYAETYLPYDANAEYDIEAYHSANVTYEQQTSYVDYYNYIEYTYGDSVNYPYWFDFTGNGPPQPISFKNILLGTTYALFSGGAVHGPPDHLKVLSDVTEDNCGTKDRRIRFQVVDANGRRAGTTQTKESFHDPNTGAECPNCAYNSCRGEFISASGCSTDLLGVFTDHLSVGCPLISGECGTAFFISKWSWCPRERPSKVLASNTYHLGRSFVHVNGVDKITDGTHLYP